MAQQRQRNLLEVEQVRPILSTSPNSEEVHRFEEDIARQYAGSYHELTASRARSYWPEGQLVPAPNFQDARMAASPGQAKGTAAAWLMRGTGGGGADAGPGRNVGASASGRRGPQRYTPEPAEHLGPGPTLRDAAPTAALGLLGRPLQAAGMPNGANPSAPNVAIHYCDGPVPSDCEDRPPYPGTPGFHSECPTPEDLADLLGPHSVPRNDKVPWPGSAMNRRPQRELNKEVLQQRVMRLANEPPPRPNQIPDWLYMSSSSAYDVGARAVSSSDHSAGRYPVGSDRLHPDDARFEAERPLDDEFLDESDMDDILPEDLPSKGSALHKYRTCKPCAFAIQESRVCRNGFECEFCHLCEPGERKRRKKERLAMRREMRRELQNHKRWART